MILPPSLTSCRRSRWTMVGISSTKALLNYQSLHWDYRWYFVYTTIDIGYVRKYCGCKSWTMAKSLPVYYLLTIIEPTYQYFSIRWHLKDTVMITFLALRHYCTIYQLYFVNRWKRSMMAEISPTMRRWSSLPPPFLPRPSRTPSDPTSRYSTRVTEPYHIFFLSCRFIVVLYRPLSNV